MFKLLEQTKVLPVRAPLYPERQITPSPGEPFIGLAGANA